MAAYTNIGNIKDRLLRLKIFFAQFKGILGKLGNFLRNVDITQFWLM